MLSSNWEWKHVRISHKSSTVRAEAARLMAAIVDRLGAAKSLSGTKDVTERILPAAAHFIQDGSLDARYSKVNKLINFVRPF